MQHDANLAASRWDAALFDMDGLLLDSEALSWQAFQVTTAEFEMDEHFDVFASLIGANQAAGRALLDQAFSELIDVDRFAKVWEAHYHNAVDRAPVPVKPGVHEILQYLTATGVKCAVATSTRRELAESKLERSGLRQYFRTVTGGDQVENSKPAPDIYHLAGRTVDADMACSLGFEDSHNGVISAVAAGLQVFQIPDLVMPSDDLLALGHRVCKDMHEAQAVLQGQVTRQ